MTHDTGPEPCTWAAIDSESAGPPLGFPSLPEGWQLGVRRGKEALGRGEEGKGDTGGSGPAGLSEPPHEQGGLRHVMWQRVEAGGLGCREEGGEGMASVGE
jgi:hypothetical protein